LLSLSLAKAFSVSRPGWQPAYFASFSLLDAGTVSNICGGCEPAHNERATTAHQQTMIENASLNERITQMLTEARVVLPGVQALLGFQLISVISQSFEKLPASSKLVHAVSLGCITVAVILLMAPAAYHRIVFSGQDADEVHRVGSWFVTWATIPLAFGLAGDVYVVLTEITTSARIGASIAGAALVFLVGLCLWHVFPVVVRLRRDH